MKYISRGIALDEETWEAFSKLREVHGSYNKALRFMLSAGGVFEPVEPRQMEVVNAASRTAKAGDRLTVVAKKHTLHSGARPVEGCADCAALKR